MWLKATAGQTPQTDRCRIPYRTPNRSGRQEPMVSRIYVEKKPGFDVEAQQLKGELTEILGIKGIEALRIINRYDVEGIDEELFRSCVPTVFSEPQVDVTYDELPASDGAVFAVEFLPGQFDQRADSASECVQLISQGERPAVRSAKVYMISGALDEAAIEAIKHYVVNPVEARIASLDLPETLHIETPEPQPVEVLDGFRELDEAGLAAFIADRGLAMDEADIAFCQQYFRDEDRDPTITEIRVIDTYWSDHCRHTTFGTVLDDVTIDGVTVPRNTPLYGSATISGDRLQIEVSSLVFADRIFRVEAVAYDLDGRPGLNIPDTRERTALKEALAAIGQTAGTSINVTRSAGQEIVSELARGGLQASSRYVAEKLREVRVTLKTDHRMLLISKE